ncbi:hypothetical protein B0H63DRAFT_520659 [Podospora didyma]|uniref:Uncharacterized protein n=1 Tax=Podospora didyma TaxID=330526 RepID=A0AAE0NRX0_9PEZI|nr:hypothetical protein B0H63DRAFT_520659 [Podospora didyma]
MDSHGYISFPGPISPPLSLAPSISNRLSDQGDPRHQSQNQHCSCQHTAVLQSTASPPVKDLKDSCSDESNKPTQRYRASPHSHHRQWTTWILEIGALCLSIAAAVSAALVLSSYNGKPREEWRFFTSINTVISILGVISKVNLAFAVSSALAQQKWIWFRAQEDDLRVFEKFDDSTRGPWGSLTLLLWSRARNLATLGAFVILTTLLVDPFLQATVSLHGQNDAVDQTSSATHPQLPVANGIHIGQWFDDPKESGDGALYSEDGLLYKLHGVLPDFGLTSAIFDGFYRTSLGNRSKDQAVRFSCETGNCTWPLYTTAAICSRCNSVPQSKIVKSSGATKWFTVANDQYSANRTSTTPLPWTAYNLSYGHIKQWDGTYNAKTPVMMTAFINTNYAASVTFQHSNTTFASFLIMRASDEFLFKGVNWNSTWPTVTECGLYFCAKAYKSVSTNGLLQETEVGSWAVREVRSWKAADKWRHWPNQNLTLDLEKLQRWDKSHQSLGPVGVRFPRSDLQIRIPSAALPAGAPGNTRHTFNITQTSVMGLQQTLRDMFLRQQSRFDTGRTLNYVVYPIIDPATSTSIANILWNATANLTSAFEAIAHRLTVQIRDSSGTVNGTAERYVLHIRVNWGFFSLLVSTVMLGCVYFAIVLVQTHRLALPAWKGSVYPTLAFGFDETTQALLRSVDHDKDDRGGGSWWTPGYLNSGMMIRLHDDTGGEYKLRGSGQRLD